MPKPDKDDVFYSSEYTVGWPPAPLPRKKGDDGTGWRDPVDGSRKLLSQLTSPPSSPIKVHRVEVPAPSTPTHHAHAAPPKTPTHKAKASTHASAPGLPLTAIRGTPGGADRRPEPTVAASHNDLDAPSAPRDRVLNQQAVREWTARRLERGIATSPIDVAVARIRHNNACATSQRQGLRNAAGFHVDYELNGDLRKQLSEAAEADITRIARPYDWQTDSLTFVFSARPETNPDNLELNDPSNPSSMVVTNWRQLKFGFEFIPEAFKVNGHVHPAYRATVHELRRHILRTFVKPHVETWAYRRNLSGHPGQLAGERRPFTQETSDPDLVARYDRAFNLAHRLALPQVGRPRLPEHVVSITDSVDWEKWVFYVLTNNPGSAALAKLEEKSFEKPVAAYAVFVAAQDEEDGFDLKAMWNRWKP
ncbi:hypothetical protein AURDEDRAFT_126376 [Auricularia subglabra TFB-10046 SS5]|nr:hypothetical protein AURDEDRAFT_126376 [Auricularia subglabra TFB-10046 SS5]